jgi:hypothetical protein
MGSTGRDGPGAREESAGARARPSFLAASREPVIIAIFVLAGIFEVLSGDPFVHGAVLFAVAGALSWDAIRRRREAVAQPTEPKVSSATAGDMHPGPAEPVAGSAAKLRLTPAMVFAGVAYAIAVGTFGRYSWPSTVAVVGPGAAGVAVAWRRPTHEEPAPLGLDPWGTLAWVAVFLALALWELAALLLQPSLSTPSAAHPTISTLMDPTLASHLGRSITLILWLGFGWFLLER